VAKQDAKRNLKPLRSASQGLSKGMKAVFNPNEGRKPTVWNEDVATCCPSYNLNNALQLAA
jgi:hypothetical protein